METIKTFNVKYVNTIAYTDQKMGTSGLRKKVKVFQQEHYPENFIQSVFDAYDKSAYQNKSVIIGGDGRFYNDVVIQKTIKIAAAHYVKKVILAENGLMSTPAVSLLIRAQPKDECFGAFILTSSHNPGGADNDMGIKFNNETGAAIPEYMNNIIYDKSKVITKYKLIDYENDFSLTQAMTFKVKDEEDGNINHDVEIVIANTTSHYISEMKRLFDFELIRSLFQRKDFSFVFDGLNGISGPYAIEIFHKEFGVPLNNLHNCKPLPDFGGLHPDPNLVHAKLLVELCDVFKHKDDVSNLPDFGAACDGDADRNMILGKQLFVIPSDCLAVLAANAEKVNCLKGLKGVARSMPTSSAVDRVAKRKGIPSYETPTGWKFFGNLLDSGRISLCGEEAFGTGSDHAREKDGIWAILCWLSILAERNKDNKGTLIGLKEVMVEHWKVYGRQYYCRYDYEDLTNEETVKVKEKLTESIETFKKMKEGNEAYVFEYKDPVDGNVSKNQGWVFKFANGTRIVFRVSGTASTGTTIRMYFEKHVDPDGDLFDDVFEIIKKGELDLPKLAVELSNIHAIANRTGPTLMT